MQPLNTISLQASLMPKQHNYFFLYDIPYGSVD